MRRLGWFSRFSEPYAPLDILFWGVIPEGLRFWRQIFRALLVAGLSYALMRFHPGREVVSISLSLLIGFLSLLTLTRWVVQFALALLIALAIIPQGYLAMLLR